MLYSVGMTTNSVYLDIPVRDVTNAQVKEEERDEHSGGYQFACGLVLMEDLKKLAFYMAILAEVVVTFILVFVGCATACSNPSSSLAVPFAFGLALAAGIWTLGHVSGCHANPAVSTSFFITGNISLIRFALYVGAQILGASIAALTLKAFEPWPPGNATCTCLNAPGPMYNSGQAFFAEVIATFLLVFVIHGTTDRGKNQAGSAALAIGFVITMNAQWAGGISGGSMNPARTFGPALISGTFDGSHWVYWLGPIMGASIAAIFYKACFATYEERTDKKDK